MARYVLTFLVFTAIVAPAFGDTVIVDENFDQYAGDAELIAVWVPRDGSGNNPAAVTDAGILTTDDTLFPGVQGKAVDHIGSAVNQYEPASGGPFPGSELIPTESQSVFVSVDFFDGASGNERMTLGLRNRTSVSNIIEMGLYNSNSCDPTVCSGIAPQNATVDTPGFYPGTGYATRTQLFSGFSEPLLVQPDWQYFQLPIELDRTTDTDEIVSIGDIGPGWHRYTATVTPTSVTYTIDLFRDGVRNDTRDEDGVVVGEGTPGVDATMEFPVTLNAVGFDSLRIGGPSGLSSAGTGATGFDNILLMLVDEQPPMFIAGDFDGNNSVGNSDLTLLLNNWGEPVPPIPAGWVGAEPTADAIGNDELTALLNTWGDTQGSGAALAAAGVPEPASVLLLAAAALVLAGAARGRRD
jgi:hypothetical protein